MIIILNGYMKDSLSIHSLHERDRNVRYRGKIPVSLCIKAKYPKNSDRKNPSSNLFKSSRYNVSLQNVAQTQEK